MNSFLIWLLDHWRISSGEHMGEPYSFLKYPYLQTIAMDEHPLQCYKKSAQGGLSELTVARMLWYADTRLGNHLYAFPRTSQLKEFVDARIRAAIFSNSYLSSKINGAMNLHRIEFNNKQIYFRGSQFRRQMISVDVSHMFLDEIDEMDEGVLYTLEKRLGAASNPVSIFFSTPTYPGVGISPLYMNSDRREWFSRCTSCSKFTRYLYEDDKGKRLLFGNPTQVHCERCASTIQRGTPGEWVARSRNRPMHGYAISKLITPFADLDRILVDSEDPLKQQECYNSDLGLAFEPRGSKLDRDTVKACRGDYISQRYSSVPCSIGIDVGKTNHYVIMQKKEGKIRIVQAGTADFSQFPSMMKDYSISCGVVDSLPETQKASEFQKKYPRKIYLARYPNWTHGDTELYREKKEDRVVEINRTFSMTTLMQLIISRELQLPRDIESTEDFMDHMISPIRVLKEEKHGGMIPAYPKTGKPDHYFHASLYAMIASSLQPRTVTQILHGMF